jgi:hypothetical protein
MMERISDRLPDKAGYVLVTLTNLACKGDSRRSHGPRLLRRRLVRRGIENGAHGKIRHEGRRLAADAGAVSGLTARDRC